eukprot:gene47340-57989_t
MSTLPSLSALRAFEAAARHLSVTLAARELCVTPGAVSLQVKELEAALGVQLFLRRPRSLALTAEGADYFATLRTAFRLMREATAEITARARPAVLTLTCTPGFALQWLVPRLGGFEARMPGIDVRISPSNRRMDFALDGIDLAVRHGFGRYEGLVAERLVDDELVPVCSPAFRDANGPWDEAAFARCRHVHLSTRAHAWRDWYAQQGWDYTVHASRGPRYELFTMVTAATAA